MLSEIKVPRVLVKPVFLAFKSDEVKVVVAYYEMCFSVCLTA
jgi:hypothetical protein